jgi:hypothetical protein
MQAYMAIFLKQQKQPSCPEILLLAAAMSYLWKGLIKRSDDMSSSVDMATDLRILQRVEKYGFASIHGKCIDMETGYQVAEAINPSTFRILNYSNQIKPGGQRLKTSHLNRVPKARRQQEEQLRHEEREERGGEEAQPTPPAPVFQEAVTQAAGQVLWTDDDRSLLERTLLQRLPQWLWAQFPRDYLRRPPPAREGRIKRKPLTQSSFKALTEPDASLQGLQRPANGFRTVVDKLFPAGWRFSAAQNSSMMRSFDESCLLHIRHHIQSKPEALRDSATRAFRERMHIALSAWEFLPAIQGRRVWSLADRGGAKAFAVYFNPSYTP